MVTIKTNIQSQFPAIQIQNKKTKQNLDENCIAAEKLELFHGGGMERDDGVVIVDGFVDNESVRRLLPLKDRGTEILLR